MQIIQKFITLCKSYTKNIFYTSLKYFICLIIYINKKPPLKVKRSQVLFLLFIINKHTHTHTYEFSFIFNNNLISYFLFCRRYCNRLLKNLFLNIFKINTQYSRVLIFIFKKIINLLLIAVFFCALSFYSLFVNFVQFNSICSYTTYINLLTSAVNSVVHLH